MLQIRVDDRNIVSGLLRVPAQARACYLFAHGAGAGAGMAHPFMAAVADGLADRHIATLRYQFPAMEQGLRRPDVPSLAHATVRAAADVALRQGSPLPLFAGGKSFGGRMTSQAQAEAPLPGVHGLIFLGFPLHAAKKPSVERADHLAGIRVPMLFLQGNRDPLANMALLGPIVANLEAKATMVVVADADHAFHVRRRAGLTDAEVLAAMLDDMVAWIEKH